MSELPQILFIDRNTATSLLDLKECIEVVQAAFEAHAMGKSYEPQLVHVTTESGEFHIKTGGIRGPHSFFACKVGGGFFNNRKTFGWPNIMGMLALFDANTGAPLAVIESGALTKARTGAATAVAARYLARPTSSVVTVCGAGNQAESQLRALSLVLPIRKVFIWSRSGARDFAAKMSRELGIQVEENENLRSASLQSDVVVTCTPSKQWFLSQADVAEGTFVAAIGADSPDKQELDPNLLAHASVVCDLTSQCVKVGELHHAMDAGLMTPERVRGDLGDVIIGRTRRRETDNETIIFDSTGTALQDVATAVLVYERARVSKKGQLNSLY